MGFPSALVARGPLQANDLQRFLHFLHTLFNYTYNRMDV